MARLHLGLLGGFEARGETGARLPIPLRKAQALLAYLASPVGRSHSRDALAALLWGGMPDAQARSGLRQTVWSLRQAGVPREAFEAGRESLALTLGVVEVDVATFEMCAESATADGLAEAAALYRGELLAGLTLREAPFEDWLRIERERLREIALRALSRRLDHQQRAGANDSAVTTAGRLLSIDPLQESAHRALMRGYLALGRRGAALRQYQTCADLLQRELRVEPETETRALYREALHEPVARRAIADVEPSADAPAVPMLGREAEWSRVRASLDAAWSGAGTVVAVVGEAGVGKSRLLAEVEAEARRRGARVLIGHAHESEQILAFGPWVDAFQSGRVAADAHTLDALPAAAQAALSRLLPDARAVPEAPVAIDALQLFHAVAQLIERLAADAPLLLILEDAHWADEMSLRLLAFVARRLANRRVLIAASVRTDDLVDAQLVERTLADLEQERHLVHIALHPLDASATATLARRLAHPGTPAADGALDAQVWAATGGNPFMITELAGALRDGAAAPDSGALPIPERVRALVMRRLARLREPSRHALAVAAVLNREIEYGLLRHAAGLDDDATAGAVEELVRRNLLRSVGERLDIPHDRIRSVVYGELLPPRRAQLHRQVAAALEAMPSDDASPLAIGTHHRLGEVWDKAATFLQRAGDLASSRCAHREAIACWRQALDAMARLPQTPETTAAAIALRERLGMPLGQLAMFADLIEHCAQLERDAETHGDPLRRVFVYPVAVFALASLGRLHEAVETGERGLALAAHLPSNGPAAAAWIEATLARVHAGLGNHRRAADLAGRSVATLTGRAPDSWLNGGRASINARAYRTLDLATLGEFEEGIRCGDEAVRMSLETTEPRERYTSFLYLGSLYLIRGDLDTAAEWLERTRPLWEHDELIINLPRAMSALGLAYAQAGRLDDGIALLEQGVARGREIGLLYDHSQRLAHLGEGYLLAGRIADAERAVVEGLARAEGHGERGNVARLCLVEGDIAARRGDSRARSAGTPRSATRAEASYRRALDLADALGMRPIAARCRLGLGAVLVDAAAGRTLIEQAIAELDAMGMTRWSALGRAAMDSRDRRRRRTKAR